MPNYTTNLNLEKPLDSEQYDISVFNSNADKIDNFAGQIPARSLTADKLTTGAKINNVLFKGDTNITLPVATNSVAGTVKPDNDSILVDENGVIRTAYPTTIDFINNSKALATGAKSLNPTVYADIEKYAHSTFDLSKFNVVGTPNITTDGVISGFSATDYMKVQIGNCNYYRFKIRITDFAENLVPILVRSGYNRIIITQYGYVSVWADENNATGNEVVIDNSSAMQLSVNTDYIVEVTLDGTNATATITNVATGVSNTASKPFTHKMPDALNTYWIGSDSGRYLHGTIDLKYLSTKYNDIPVFSGNKTGVDEFVEPNFTKVGSISVNNGIASGFSASDYVTAQLGQADIYKFRINLSALPALIAPVILMSGYNRIAISQYGYITIFADETNTTANSIVIDNSNAMQLSVNTDYIVEVTLDGVNATATITNVATGVSNTASRPFTHKMPDTLNTYWIGSDGSRYVDGTIDLNSVMTVKDGKITYLACLYIPYTQSAPQYGSKVVDMTYYDRLQTASVLGKDELYYSLNEANKTFALPIGELYGMIEKIKLAATVDVYTSGNTQVWKYKDGRLIMTGRYEWQLTTIDVPFVQPVLSADGTPGGADFAVFSSTPLYPQFPAYNAFDNDNSTFFEGSLTDPCYIGFYNPDALKVTNITVTNGLATRETTAYAIDYSDNGEDWTELTTGSTSVTGAGSTFNINLASNTGYHQYYRLRSNGIKYGWTVAGIAITAVYVSSGGATLNRITLPQTFVNNTYGFIFSGYGGSVSGVYVAASGQNTSYIDLSGTATSGTYLNWQAIGQWK